MAISVFVPKAPTVTNWELVPSTAYTLSDSTSSFGVDFFSTAGITLAVTSCSGTLDVYMQKLLGDETTWMDFAAFPQFTTNAVFTTTGTYELAFVNGGNSILMQTDATLSGNTVRLTNFGASWRVKFKIGGASGTSTFGVFGTFTE